MLAAQAAYKVVVAKDALLDIVPQGWPSNEMRHRRFVRWLARRFDRFALPDALDDAFRKPLDRVLAAFQEEHSRKAEALSRACHEWCINQPAQDKPPFTVFLSLLLDPEGLSAEADDVIDDVLDQLRNALDASLVTLDAEVRKLTEAQMSLAEFYATVPLFLEPMTYEGDEIIGASPLPRG